MYDASVVKETAKVTLEGYDPYDKDYGTGTSGLEENPSPFARINAWRQQFLDTPLGVSAERAVLWTEKFKENSNKPHIIRCAECFAHVLKNVSIEIGKYELVAGNMAAPPRCAPVFPEFSYEWLVEEMDNKPFEKRPGDRFLITEETKQQLRDIREFWKNRTVHDLAKSLMPATALKGTGSYGKGIYLLGNYFFGGVGHTSARYEKIYELGWKGLQDKIDSKLSELDPCDPSVLDKIQFYQAQLICLDGIMTYCRRYANLARQMAPAAEGERKQELLQMADNLDWIAENPPRSFWEALQLWWMLTVVITIEGNGHSIHWGRFDQHLYPFFRKDMAEGKITKAFVQELIEGAWIKISELTKIRDEGSTKAFGGVELGGPSLTIGGQTPEGEDATNELSFMCVDAMAHVRLNAPWLTSRWHANSPREWWIKVTKVAKLGLGMPSFFNDEIIIPSMVNRGRTIEDSRDYGALGCVEPNSEGREYGWHDAAFFNMNKVLELAINNGKCTGCSAACPMYDQCVGAGETLGLQTGSLADFSSFDEVREAYDKQMKYWVDRLVMAECAMDVAHQTRKPLPYLSLLVEDCIDKGKDVTAGGARYNFIGPQGVGVSNVADGLSAIKKLVFEDKKISGADLLDALEKNWEGYEPIYALINSAKVPHYGNDDEEVDDLARWGAKCYCKHLERRPTPHGGEFQAGLYPVSANVPFGAITQASPDGRKAGEPVADGVSPVHTSRGSHDVSGPTAVVKSVSALDHGIASNGTLLNMKFSPSTLAGETGDENFIGMMKVYFQRKGMHNQINVISRSVLEDAMDHPEKYKGLIVRVAGYSAFFTELDPSVQRDILERTELEF
ncbi:formate C-acetyltransferase/glycerol dehydratase family glycyl radical enzyme [Syntrophotalea acetylenica]|uniref:glycyl radical protein n=1 Tax=Syntrophotalea acetylenica TaxID=29542 RepID=UPI002A35A009|nr:formate C-acetyltransferase/glycerol dehydratase family glycyl radical enzyme [Syntrophotalea acetylenica]MDY0261629.1 formate C-acetyltransferase/glycerol dehydratase family glycyl radical enzyme [Syntrophotalea acetylenica]